MSNNSNKRIMKIDKEELCSWLLIAIIVTVMCILMQGCTVTKYIPEYHERIVYKTDSVFHRDSLYTRDSIYVDRKGDTVFINKLHVEYKNVIHSKTFKDSIFIHDSIAIPPVTKYVEKKLSTWQTIKMDAGCLAIGGVILALVYIVIRLYKKFKI